MTIQEDNFTLLSDAQTLDVFIARPIGTGPYPGVVVIQEVFGLNDNIRSTCRRLAEEGYAALAIDFYSGGLRVFCVFKTIRAVLSSDTNNYSTRHLRNALTYLGQQPYVNADRLGAIGFCMGGNFALALANEDKRLKTIAPFYALTPKRLKTNISGLCPVVGSYPGKDFTTDHGHQLGVALKKTSVAHDIKIYPDTYHSFMNEGQSAYNPQVAADAWQRTMAFFAQHL